MKCLVLFLGKFLYAINLFTTRKYSWTVHRRSKLKAKLTLKTGSCMAVWVVSQLKHQWMGRESMHCTLPFLPSPSTSALRLQLNPSKAMPAVLNWALPRARRGISISVWSQCTPAQLQPGEGRAAAACISPAQASYTLTTAHIITLNRPHQRVKAASCTGK